MISLWLAGKLYAQQNRDIFTILEAPSPSGGKISITQEEKIWELFNLHLTQQRALNGIRGYRITIFMESGQRANENANKVRAGFISKYEDMKCYKVWEYPYYKLYVGDFRTKSDAIRFSRIIDNDYPDAFITRGMVIAFPE